MRRHKILSISLAAASALALAGCGPRHPDPRGVGPGEVLLTVSATGTADTKPDEARFQVGVTSAAATAKAAQEANTTKMNAVIEALKAAGVAEKDMQTKQISVSRSEWGVNKGKFEATNSIEVRMRDIDKAGAAIAAATEAGANTMWGPTLGISDPEASGRSAYMAAFKSARAKADAYAEAAGMKVARLLRIRDGSSGGAEPPMPMEMMDVRTANAAPQVTPGMNTQGGAVTLDFALAPK